MDVNMRIYLVVLTVFILGLYAGHVTIGRPLAEAVTEAFRQHKQKIDELLEEK